MEKACEILGPTGRIHQNCCYCRLLISNSRLATLHHFPLIFSFFHQHQFCLALTYFLYYSVEWFSFFYTNHIMSEQLTFPAESAALLEPRLPPKLDPEDTSRSRPFVTLTFATSLDSSLSLAPGVRTRLSGPGSKAMTHYLRTRHSAILVGVSTVLADDPALNCRIAGASCQPRPIVIDANLRWTPRRSDKVFEVCRSGAGLAPFILTGVDASALPRASVELLHGHGGKYIHVPTTRSEATGRLRFNWDDILAALQAEHLSSVMVEGGGQIINSLLEPAYHNLIDSVIVTIAPTWLGQGGVVVSPDRVTDSAGVPFPVARLSHVSWHPFGEDVVLCGTLRE